MDEIDKRINALEAAERVFCWYYIFGEDSEAARNLLADLGNKLRVCGYLNLSNQGLTKAERIKKVNKLETTLPHKVDWNTTHCPGCWNLTWNGKTSKFHATCNECGVNFDIESDITILWRII